MNSLNCKLRFLEIGHVPKDKIDAVKDKFKKTIELLLRNLPSQWIRMISINLNLLLN